MTMFLDTNNTEVQYNQIKTQNEVENLEGQLASNENEINSHILLRKWLNIALIFILIGFITNSPSLMAVLVVPLGLWFSAFYARNMVKFMNMDTGEIRFVVRKIATGHSGNSFVYYEPRLYAKVGGEGKLISANTVLGDKLQQAIAKNADMAQPKLKITTKFPEEKDLEGTWIGGDPYVQIKGLRLASILEPVVKIKYIIYSSLLAAITTWFTIESLATGKTMYTLVGMIGYAIILAMVLLLWYRTKNGSTYKLLLEIEKTLENRIAELEKSKKELVESE